MSRTTVEKTGIDALAPALGSVHGPYKGEPKLGFKWKFGYLQVYH